MSRGFFRVIEPVPHTCPKIDEVIGLAEEFYHGDEPLTLQDLSDIRALMEEIRDANSKLRAWGIESTESLYEAQDELESANSTISNLEQEIDYLKDQIKSYESELASLQN